MSKPTWNSDAPDSELEYEELLRRDSEIQRLYPGQCIARRGARVIANAPRWEEVYDRLDELKEPRDEGLMMEFVFRSDVFYIL